MLHKFIVEIETPESDRGTFNRLDRLLNLYTGRCLPFTTVTVNYMLRDAVEANPEQPTTR
jgi:hypothetical protein